MATIRQVSTPSGLSIDSDCNYVLPTDHGLPGWRVDALLGQGKVERHGQKFTVFWPTPMTTPQVSRRHRNSMRASSPRFAEERMPAGDGSNVDPTLCPRRREGPPDPSRLS